jgi:uncharacterized protein YjbI with pentapeptide repeats
MNKYIEIIEKGVENWNQWKTEFPEEKPHMIRANLSKSNLTGYDLTNIYLSWADLLGVDFTAADLSFSNLIGADLRDAIFNKTVFIKSNLSHAYFGNSDLKDTNFLSADLTETSFIGTNITHVNFTGANIEGANFSGAMGIPEWKKHGLTNGIYSQDKLIHSIKNGAKNLKESILRKANLNNINLEKADLSDADLIWSDLTKANLENAILQSADLRKVNFNSANLKGADLRNADLRNANFMDATLNKAILCGADLSGANLTRTILIESDLRKADLTCANLYASSRDNWKINDIICDFIFFDKDWQERFPEDRIFEKNEFEEIYQAVPDFDRLIIRSIEFPQEYYQAGISILNYFSTVLRKKYKEKDAKVEIKQDGLKVTMIVDPVEGEKQVIEKALDEFGLVISGRMSLEEFTDDPFLAIEFKQELKIAKARIESQRELLQIQNTQIDDLKKMQHELLHTVGLAVQSKGQTNIHVQATPHVETKNIERETMGDNINISGQGDIVFGKDHATVTMNKQQSANQEGLILKIDQLKEELAKLALDEKDKSALDLYISTLENQAKIENKNPTILKASLETITNIIQGTAGSALFEIIKQIGMTI